MKRYIHHFRILFIIAGVLGAIYLVLFLTMGRKEYERTSTEEVSAERVFDYAQVLNDEEEEKLQKLIDKRQRQIGCDIVILTISDSLEDFINQNGSDSDIPYAEYVRIYANWYYDTEGYGYDQSGGDGALYLDNWNRSVDGWAYTWFLTSGKVYDSFGDARVNDLINKVAAKTNDSPYKAYRTYVNEVYRVVSKKAFLMEDMLLWLVIASLVAGVVYVISGSVSKIGKETTTPVTYIVGGKPTVNRQEDQFLTKHVTKTRIQSSSSGGGGSRGGGGGGGSRGGGGGRH